jgi:hypothetical protein
VLTATDQPHGRDSRTERIPSFGDLVIHQRLLRLASAFATLGRDKVTRERQRPRRFTLGLAVAVLSGRHPGQDHFAGLNSEALAGEVILVKDPGHFAIDSGRLYVVTAAVGGDRGMSNGFALSTGSSCCQSASVGRWSRLNNAAPSVQLDFGPARLQSLLP